MDFAFYPIAACFAGVALVMVNDDFSAGLRSLPAPVMRASVGAVPTHSKGGCPQRCRFQ
jgi:hypothetical protein